MKRTLTLILVFILGLTFGVLTNIPYARANDTEVYIDIKPGACPNYLNINSKGYVQIAVLGTQYFDVTTIDPETVFISREGVEGAVKSAKWVYEDVATPLYEKENPCDCHNLDGDGYVDLVLKFDTQDLLGTLNLTELAGETVPLDLTGNLKGEAGIIGGQDCVLVINQ